MSAASFTAALGERVIDLDLIDSICHGCREPEGACLCEADSAGRVETLERELQSARQQIAVLEGDERVVLAACEQVIQAETLDEAKRVVRAYLGLEAGF